MLILRAQYLCRATEVVQLSPSAITDIITNRYPLRSLCRYPQVLQVYVYSKALDKVRCLFKVQCNHCDYAVLITVWLSQ